MDRRELLRWLPAGAALGCVGLMAERSPAAAQEGQQTAPPSPGGLPPVKIKDIRTILTAPNRIRLVIVKVLTSEPGLHGVGCATFTQRPLVVQTAVEQYLKPFLVGRNVDEIEDIWQSAYVSSYWRNGPVLFNAMSGVDMALWDIKGKRANMPVYQLLGGKCRLAVDCYAHTSGRDFQEAEDAARKAMERGYRHVRVQVAVPGMATYGTGPNREPTGETAEEPDGPTNPKAIWEPSAYVRVVPKLFEHMRKALGDDVELLHDVHERVSLPQGIKLCKDLEQYRPFFVEDPFPPEQNDHFRLLRQQCSTPIAMGELFNTQHEYVPLIANRLIDYIRIHISQIGGLSMARKVAALAEFFGVKTAWHGPGDCSPVGHAAGLALELSSYNFGIHEAGTFPPETREVFPGCPEIKNGAMYAHEAPGLGIDVDEKAAAKFPFSSGRTFDHRWGTTRRRDGSVIRP
ncbi:MAG TPA: enolase C-terminal domain-like protein [Isosphaeraceae bacterium]|jgi:mannonate dehydratase|nr:enolase C-terminal domain-like protein [Isosphaeraceae bacterium]